MKVNKLLLLIILIISISCNDDSKDKKEDNAFIVDEYDIKLGEDLSSEEWTCKNIESELTCFPINWKPIKQKSFHFFAYIDSSKKDQFYVIGKFDKDSLDITEQGYVKATFNRLKNDSLEMLAEYNIKKLIFEDGIAYFSEYTVQKKSTKYIIYSMTFTHNSILFDITLKVKDSKKNYYKNIFQNILYNFKISNKRFFSREKEILEFKFINPKSL